jgi:hypothetical protein
MVPIPGKNFSRALTAARPPSVPASEEKQLLTIVARNPFDKSRPKQALIPASIEIWIGTIASASENGIGTAAAAAAAVAAAATTWGDENAQFVSF